jgi:hypothetical protein
MHVLSRASASRRQAQLDDEARKARAKAVRIEDEIVRRGIRLKRTSPSNSEGPCPQCGGDDRFSINPVKQVFRCRQCNEKGGDVIALVQWLDNCGFGEAIDTLAGERPKANGKAYEKSDCTPQTVATFRYTDAGGEALLYVDRVEYLQPDGKYLLGKDGKRKKDFLQRRPDPDRPGQWIKHGPFAAVPYRLPGLMAALQADPETEVFIVEGEAKVDLLRDKWNLSATCNAQGGKQWKDEHSAYLRDANVTIVPDNDEAGREHLKRVAEKLHGIAKRIRILELPDLPVKGDVINWERAGHTCEEFLALADKAREWMPSQESEESTSDASLPPLTYDEWEKRELPEPDYISGSWLSTTSRVALISPTGKGKTNFGMQLGYNISLGKSFLHWHGRRKCRVLYIDGEMSRRLLRDRLRDCRGRAGGEVSDTFFALSHEDVEDWKPLNTKQGQAYINRLIKALGGVDLIIFDSIMCLIVGSMREEEPWSQTMPLIKSLTKRGIAQIWIHHTGHDETRGYGDKTREWQLDTVIFLIPEKRDDTDVSFTIEFRKARERTPQTREDFRDAKIALVNNEWTYDEGASAFVSKTKGKRDTQTELAWRFLNEALAEFGTVPPANGRIPGDTRVVTLDQWRHFCDQKGLSSSDQKDSQNAAFRRSKNDLQAAGDIGIWNKQVWVARQT